MVMVVMLVRMAVSAQKIVAEQGHEPPADNQQGSQRANGVGNPVPELVSSAVAHDQLRDFQQQSQQARAHRQGQLHIDFGVVGQDVLGIVQDENAGHRHVHDYVCQFVGTREQGYVLGVKRITG